MFHIKVQPVYFYGIGKNEHFCDIEKIYEKLIY